MNKYIPPFTITTTMLDRISSIMKKVGKLENSKDLNKMSVLRRNNRIESIHSSLAIEANSLSFDQVKDVIDGKVVIGPKKEIQEVKNAYNAISIYVKKLLDVMKPNINYTTRELMNHLGMKSRISFRENYLIPAIENGVVKMTFPNTPTSKNQTYYKN